MNFKDNYNIAIVGLGNVGSEVYRHLIKNKRVIEQNTNSTYQIKYISAKKINKKRGFTIPKKMWVKNPLSLVKKDDVDIIIELIGGPDGIAKNLAFAALKNNKHYITANKALMFKHGNELAKIAEKNSVNLLFEASVGGGIPIAAGAALASKMMKRGTVAVSFFGDGAMNEGAFHEAANLAAIWQLPMILFCENNKYGMSSSTEKAFAIDNLADRGKGYGIPSVNVDGNDVVAVYEVAQAAVDRAKAGDGPTLIIAETYRWKGHSRSDKNLYRTKEEIEEWRTKDPIPKFIARVVEEGILTQEQCDVIQNEAIEAIKAAVNEAVKAESAEPSGLLDAVFKAVSA
jgi:TPP-dependent pyruvate/acetoin dehydrogenase alpha subunit